MSEHFLGGGLTLLQLHCCPSLSMASRDKAFPIHPSPHRLIGDYHLQLIHLPTYISSGRGSLITSQQAWNKKQPKGKDSSNRGYRGRAQRSCRLDHHAVWVQLRNCRGHYLMCPKNNSQHSTQRQAATHSTAKTSTTTHTTR